MKIPVLSSRPWFFQERWLVLAKSRNYQNRQKAGNFSLKPNVEYEAWKANCGSDKESQHAVLNNLAVRWKQFLVGSFQGRNLSLGSGIFLWNSLAGIRWFDAKGWPAADKLGVWEEIGSYATELKASTFEGENDEDACV